jgi:HK97 family phage major capsid protein
MSVSVLQKRFAELAEENAKLLHTDEGAGRSTEESLAKSEKFDANLTELKTIKAELERHNELDELNRWAATPERKAATRGAPDPTGDDRRQVKSAGRQVLESEEFKSWLKSVAPNGVITSPVGRSPMFDVKAVISGASATSGGAFVQRDYSNIYVPYVQPTLTVRDLVTNATTDSDIVEYMRADTHANAAAPVAEATSAAIIDGETVTPAIGGLKPEASFTWAKVTAGVETIAEGVPVTRRAMSDAGQLMSIIDQQLRFDLSQTLNTQMISGSGSSPNLRGIRNTSGILTQAFSNNIIETLRKAKTKVTNPATGSGKIPDGVAITPAALETLDLFRVGGSTTTDGPFLVNPYTDQVRRLWGMNLVEEPGMTADRAVLGYFRDAVLWDRQQESVQMFDQHADFAARNLVYVLAELRAAFGVLMPKSFVDVTTA